MPPNIELILLVENDPEICDMISRQILQPLDYQVRVVPEASKTIQRVIKFTPDLIISDNKQLGLSGKDLIAALNTQGLLMPIIVISKKGEKNEVKQAFQLSAYDYLLRPARDAEFVRVLERKLKLLEKIKALSRMNCNRLQIQSSYSYQAGWVC
ncbi:MAG: response regulator [Chloroflexota bacterium]